MAAVTIVLPRNVLEELRRKARYGLRSFSEGEAREALEAVSKLMKLLGQSKLFPFLVSAGAMALTQKYER